MTGGERGQNKAETRGFAGLSSLVSDVDATARPLVGGETADTHRASWSPVGHAPTDDARPEPQPRRRPSEQAPLQPLSGFFGGKWLLAVVAVIAVGWLIRQTDNQPSSSPPAYTPSAQAPSTVAPSLPAQPPRPQVPSRPQEEKPPVGQSLTFSASQIRYCLAEEIRMAGAKSGVNNYSDSDVDRFNAMVADYNNRCSSFRYRRGTLESARQEIEPYRSQLQAEGRSRLR